MTLKTMQSSLRRINRAQIERAPKAMATNVLFEIPPEALVWGLFGGRYFPACANV